MMHDMMHDGRDPSGRSRARTALRCDPLLGISLQALRTNPYLHPLGISFPQTTDLLWSSETADPRVLNGGRLFGLRAAIQAAYDGAVEGQNNRHYGPYS